MTTLGNTFRKRLAGALLAGTLLSTSLLPAAQATTLYTPYSISSVSETGATNIVTVPFPYINQADILVFVNGVQTSAFTWLTSSTLQMTASASSLSGSIVTVARRTGILSPDVHFQVGSLDPNDLNTNATQSLYSQQELWDQWEYTGSPLAVTPQPPGVLLSLFGIAQGSVPFTPPGANATITTLGARVNDQPLDLISDYGAACSATFVDNTAKIQKFLDDVVLTNRMGLVPSCPAGQKIYFASTLHETNAGNLFLMGDGPAASVLEYYGTGGGDGLDITASALGQMTVNISMLAIQSYYSGAGGSGIKIVSVPSSILTDVNAFQFATCFNYASGDYGPHVTRGYLTNCGFTDHSGGAIVTGYDASANQAKFDTVEIGGALSYAYVIPVGVAINIVSPDVEGNYGGLLLGGGSTGVSSMLIEGGYIENSGAGGNLNFIGSGATGVTGLEINGTWLGTQNPANPANWSVGTLDLRNVTLYAQGSSPYGNSPYIAAGQVTVENMTILGTAAFAAASGVITQTTDSAGIHTAGVANGAAAYAGTLGEVVSSAVASGSAVALSTGVAGNITSITLTAGDWDVHGNCAFLPANSTVDLAEVCSVDTVSAAVAQPNFYGTAWQRTSWTGNGVNYDAIAPDTTRINVTTTTTVYLVGAATFTTSTMGAYGLLWARRAH